MNQILRKLPGLYFETASPLPQQALPRMDIAAFVGFAQNGPLDTPVAVEDLARFREIFGDDIALAWDSEQGAHAHSLLGAAVGTFFKNGGRRCWVVRVADVETATTHEFSLPGLRYIGEAAEEKVAARIGVEARSPGSWSRLLRVGTALQVTQLYLNPAGSESVLQLGNEGWSARITSLPKAMYPGDLLELSFDNIEAQLYLSLSVIEPNVSGGIRFSGSSGYWFFRGSLPSPAVAGAIASGDSDWIYPLSRTADLGHPLAWLASESGGSRPRIRLLRFEIQAWNNAVLEQRLPDLAFHPAHPRFWGNLPSDTDLFADTAGLPARIQHREIERLVVQASQPRFPLAGSGSLSDDDILGETDYALQQVSILPVDMGFATDIEATVGARHAAASLARQDGLEAFDISLFLDKNLYQVGSAALLREAENRAYVREEAVRLQGLHSLITKEEITLISVPDAVHRRWDTIPPLREPGLQAPFLLPPVIEVENESMLLRWEAVEGATGYWLQQDSSPEFDHPLSSKIVNDRLQTSGEVPTLLPVPPSEVDFRIPANCPENVYFRVRAEYLGEVSPWSNSRARLLPSSSFEDCGLVLPQLLETIMDEPVQASLPDTYRLSWRPATVSSISIASYRLQVSSDMEFAAIVNNIDIGADSYHYKNITEGLLYFRVGALHDGSLGAWSNTVTIEPDTLNKLTLQNLDRFSDFDLLGIHRALLRFCAARGDILSVLSLPRHYKTQQAIDHVALLKSFEQSRVSAVGFNVPALGHGESHAFSYAAIYHPWVSVSSSDNNEPAAIIRTIPADGLVLGSMARIAADHGAWIAPANDLFNDIVALDQKPGAEQRDQLLSSQINALGQDARGFLVLSTETLSENNEYRLINVRRLLILLRRLALVEGQQFVFEPNSGSFRDRVQNRFERFMTDMYIRGAFSGANPEQAFRVITDRSVNTQRRIDLGQFIIELQVAPSRPMAFLTLRLVQSGLNQIAAQEL